ncbi:MAG: hypothetical protein E7035_04070 [Verrucomicrobiaceae bacterium]|nr:hypothetical protein [Verrucomicrobiaceae bacterium]
MKRCLVLFLLSVLSFITACKEAKFDGYRENMFIITEDCSNFFFDHKVDEKVARNYIASIPDGAVSHIFLCPTAMRLSYKSKVWESVWDEVDSSIKPVIRAKGDVKFDTWQLSAKQWHERGMNPYLIWVEECRKKNISPWFSLRMNDIHNVSDWNATLTSNFWRRNPHLWRIPYGRKFKLWNDLAFDYSHKEVRDRAIALVEEVLQMYDVDGIELDWQRFGLHLRAGREQAEAHCLTEVVERTRTLTNKYGKLKGKKIGVSVRIPQTPEYAMLVGIDAVDWAKKGLVDIIAPAPFFGTTDFRISVNEWKNALGKDVSKKVDIIPNCEMFALPRSGDDPRHVPLCQAMFDGWACCMYYNGATSLCAFNQFVDGEITKKTSGRGLSPKICADVPRRHPLSYRVKLTPNNDARTQMHDLIQLTGKPQKDVSVEINCGILPSQERKVSVVVLYDSKENVSADVSLNGVKATSEVIETMNEDMVYKLFNGDMRSFSKVRPYPPWAVFEGKVKATYFFDFSALKAGINKVEINQKQTPKTVKWIEIDINPI